MTPSNLAIQVLVESVRAVAVAEALQRVCFAATGDRRPATGDRRPATGDDSLWATASGASVAVQLASTLDALRLGFAYERCVLLVAEWQALCTRLASEGVRGGDERTPVRVTRITDFLAGWDGVMLVSDDAEDALLSATLRSRLAPRLALTLWSEISEARWHRELERLAAAVFVLPPARRPIPTALRQGIERLPLRWQPVVHECLRAPTAWTVKRLVAALFVDRRTLERRFRRAGLPTPGALLSD